MSKLMDYAQPLNKQIIHSSPTGREMINLSHNTNKNNKKVPANPRSFFIDPLNMQGYMGSMTKPTNLTYSVLRTMSTKAEPIAAIINTRLNQIARFTHRPKYDGDTGFKVTLKDKDKKMSEAAQKRAIEIEEAILRTGFETNPMRKDNFNQFCRKVIRDSLTIDALTFENVYNHKGELVEWWAVDGATIEVVADMAMPQQEEQQKQGLLPMHQLEPYVPQTEAGQEREGQIAYVQRLFGQIVAEYLEEELAYGIRNPRTDIQFALFGLSELEILIDTVTHILNAEAYNGAYFTNNNIPQGVLEIVGKYEDEHLEAFKRHWDSMLTGAINKWRVPIMALEEGQGLKFTPFRKETSKDMEYHKWLEFLTNIACAIYQIDPSEIGFKAWSGSGGQGMNSEAEKSRLDYSQDKGLFPLMQFVEDTVNTEIIDRIDPEFKFSWVGLNEEDEELRNKQRGERLSSGFTTVDEERINDDKPTVKEELLEAGVDEKLAEDLALWGKAPANSALIQVFMNSLQKQQQEEMMEQQMAMQQQMGGGEEDEQQPQQPAQQPDQQPQQPEKPEQAEKSIAIEIEL